MKTTKLSFILTNKIAQILIKIGIMPICEGNERMIVFRPKNCAALKSGLNNINDCPTR